MFINQILTKLKSLVYSKSETDSLLNGKASSSHTHTKSQITDFPSLATVATSGSYNDLSNKPSIPSNTNQLTNGAGFITSSGSCNYATTAGAVSTSVAEGSTKDLIFANMTGWDSCWIRFGGASDAGYLEIATADNANEPIYVRQYYLEGGNARTLTLLDGSGNTQFPGTVTAPTFTGNVTGNCSGTAGSVAWGNVSGRPTALSQFTNDSGFLTSADRLPIGSYIQFAGSQAPDGFLVCNGGEISRTTYSKLFAVIGTTYGSGDGSTTFNLPNLTDRFLQGSTSSGTTRNAGLPNITGSAIGLTSCRDTYHSGLYTGVFSATIFNNHINTDMTDGRYDQDINLNFDASRSNSIYGSSSTVQPPALTCLICIKY